MSALQPNENRLRVLVADDEPIARDHICGLIAEVDGLELVGAAANGEEALEIATARKPQIALLDIRMPKIQGTEVAAELAPYCSVIFTTAYDRYAVDAFSIGAVDYLLKPFGRERFAQAIARATKDVGAMEEGASELKSGSTGKRRPQKPTHFYSRDGGSVHQIAISSLVYVRGSGDYVLVCTEFGRHFTQTRLGAFEQFLPTDKFVRIHRSSIVNTSYATKYTTLPNGRLCVHLRNGELLNTSRTGAKKVKSLMSSKVTKEFSFPH